MSGKIFLVEDDRLTVAELREVLGDEFPKCDIEVADSEMAFLDCLQSWGENPPSVVIMDVMLRWSSKASKVPPPPHVLTGGFQEAGLRCLQALESKYPAAPPAVCLLTALPFSEFEGVPRGRATLRRKELDWSHVLADVAVSLVPLLD